MLRKKNHSERNAFHQVKIKLKQTQYGNFSPFYTLKKKKNLTYQHLPKSYYGATSEHDFAENFTESKWERN